MKLFTYGFSYIIFLSTFNNNLTDWMNKASDIAILDIQTRDSVFCFINGIKSTLYVRKSRSLSTSALPSMELLM